MWPWPRSQWKIPQNWKSGPDGWGLILMTLTELGWILRKAPPPPLECDLALGQRSRCPITVTYPLLTRNGRGGCELKVGDKVYISEVPQFWEWGTKQCCERSEHKFFWGFYPKLWHFWGTLVANEVKKLWNIFVLKAKGTSCLAMCLAKSGGINYITVPHPKFWGDSSPSPPVIYATVVHPYLKPLSPYVVRPSPWCRVCAMGYIPSRRASTPFGQYQVILLTGDRDIYANNVPRSLHESRKAERWNATFWSQVQYRNH